MDRIAARAPQYPDADRGRSLPGQARLLRIDWSLDLYRTFAAASTENQRTCIFGAWPSFVVFDPGGRCPARTTKPPPWPRGSPWGFPSSRCCFRDSDVELLCRASHPEFLRNRALPGVLGRGSVLVVFPLASLHCLGALCAPPLARYAGLLESLVGGRF